VLAGAQLAYQTASTTKSEASVVPGEIDKNDKTYSDGTIHLKMVLVGDINRDDAVNITDLNMLVQAYCATLGSPKLEPKRRPKQRQHNKRTRPIPTGQKLRQNKLKTNPKGDSRTFI
jgi:hypothetical protein